MSISKDVKLCALEIELIALENDVEIKPTYDMSCIYVRSNDDDYKAELLKHNFVKKGVAKENVLEIVSAKIEKTLLKYNCKIMTTYDYSSVILINSSGETKTLK